VEQCDVRLVSSVPRLLELGQDGAQCRTSSRRVRRRPRPEPLHRIGGSGLRGWSQFRQVSESDRIGAQGDERVEVHVVPVVVPRQRDVSRVAAHADVGDAWVPRETIEGRVGLDEPTVGLSFELCGDAAQAAGLHVEPRRDVRKRPIELGGVEDEQGAQHLGPRGAALRRCGDDDVIAAKRESLPARAVVHQIAISGDRHRSSFVCCTVATVVGPTLAQLTSLRARSGGSAV
jgi:hypothetical protein